MEQAATPPPARSLSIALRMAIWYAASAFALIALATGFLYWIMATSMYGEDVRDLADYVGSAQVLLAPSSRVGSPHAPEARLPEASRRSAAIFVRILDGNARTLLETPGMSRELPPPERAELASLAAPGSAARETTSLTGKPLLVMLARMPEDGAGRSVRYIQGAMNRTHDERFLAQYRDRLWLVLGASLVLCALAGHLIARSGMKPIEAMGRTAERIGSTTLHERIRTPALPSELAGLAETFNHMLDRLESAFLRISQFSDDVAHELRTPINNLQGEIELALSQAQPVAGYQEILGSCLEECTRISRIIQGLLFLARTETATDGIRRDRIDLGRELATVQAFYEPTAADAGVGLATSCTDGLRTLADRTLFQQALGNLVSNAIAHTPSGGRVNLAARADGKSITVTVTDTGCGIAPEHLPRVFDRFYRVDRARSGSAHNAGLGLAVVKRIATLHGWCVEIRSDVGRGTQVALTLPVSPRTG